MTFSPKAKILLYVLLVILVFASGSYKINLVIMCIVAVLAAKVPFSSLKRGIIPITLFLSFTFISNLLFQEGHVVYDVFGLPLTYDGLVRGGERTLRLFILILGAKVLTSTTVAEDLINAMSALLGPVGRIGFVKELVYTMSLTLRLLPIVYEEAIEVYRNLKNAEEPGLYAKIRLSVELLTSLFNRSLEKAREMSVNEETIVAQEREGDIEH